MASTTETSWPHRGTATDTWPRPAYGWYVVIVLAVANLFSAVDRTVLNLLMQMIKRDFTLTDTQLGLLQGAAFGIVHTAMTIPFGVLADRIARNRIITLGIAVWSLMTAGCGLAVNFTQLFIARMGVGVGEASLNTTVAPLISDYFPREKRTLPIAAFTFIGATGTGIAYLVGGAVSALLVSGDTWHVPIIGDLRPWQAIFLAVGLPGLLWALVTLTVAEQRHQRDNEHISNAEFWVFLKRRWNIVLPHFTGNCCLTLFSYGAGGWSATVLIRHGWPMSDVGFRLGLMYLVTIVIGGSLGGIIPQWLFRRDRQDANLLAMAIGVGLFAIPGVLFGFMETAWTVFAVMIPLSTFSIFPGIPSTAAMQEIAPARLRGRMAALYYATNGIVGLSFGGALIGFFTDHVFHNEQLVGKSISLAAITLLPIATILILIAAAQRRKLGEIQDS